MLPPHRSGDQTDLKTALDFCLSPWLLRQWSLPALPVTARIRLSLWSRTIYRLVGAKGTLQDDYRRACTLHCCSLQEGRMRCPKMSRLFGLDTKPKQRSNKTLGYDTGQLGTRLVSHLDAVLLVDLHARGCGLDFFSERKVGFTENTAMRHRRGG